MQPVVARVGRPLAERLCRLVANHSFALLEAEERGLREVLEAEFPLLEDQLLVDGLVFCDMTTTPDGSVTTGQEWVAEIVSRYRADSVVGCLSMVGSSRRYSAG